MSILFLRTKRAIVFLHDVAWIPLSIGLAYWLRFNLSTIPASSIPGMWQLFYICTPIHAVTFLIMGCYRGIWRFSSLPDLVRIFKAVALAVFISAGILLLYSRFAGLPRSVIVLYPILLFLGVSMARVFYRVAKTHRVTIDTKNRERALIVGAGRAGDFIIRDMLEHGASIPVGLVDDDQAKQGTDLHGIRVVGKINEIQNVIETLNIEVVIIAMPSAPRLAMNAIISTCAKLQIPCRTLPSLLELANGEVEISRLRPVTVADLLGRDQIKLDNTSINTFLSGKTVAVTGGGGSIGSELCRQVLAHNPDNLVILESSEYNLYEITKALRGKLQDIRIIPVLADARISKTIEHIFTVYRPNVVFHAAAYKHVPLVEENVVEAVRNNVLGTKVVVDCAIKCNVQTFVLVSTDKTVNPTNVMGATKRIAEIYCQTLNSHSGTCFITTRFGNVLGSAGSVIPLFEQQIESGGPITITHQDITRYFMTIPEAASLILQAGAIGKGGEIFVLDMGNPIKIKDLAENMIRLSGLRPYEDIRIEYVGLRPGEKMHEELFYAREKLVGTEHPKLLLANCCETDWSWLQGELNALAKAVENYDETAVIGIVKSIVPEFNRKIYDEKNKKPINTQQRKHSLRSVK